MIKEREGQSLFYDNFMLTLCFHIYKLPTLPFLIVGLGRGKSNFSGSFRFFKTRFSLLYPLEYHLHLLCRLHGIGLMTSALKIGLIPCGTRPNLYT